MRTYIVLFLFASGFLWSLKNPLGGVIVYVWTTLFRPMDFTWVPTPNLTTIAFMILVVSMLLGIIRGVLRWHWNIGVSYLLLIVLICYLSAKFSGTPQLASEGFGVVAKILAPAILISLSIQTRKDFQFVIGGFAVCIGVWAVQAAFHGLAGGQLVEDAGIGGQMSDRNDFIVAVVMTWPLWYYIGLNSKKRRYVIGSVGISLAHMLCVLLSNSRGGMLGLFGTLILNATRKGTARFRNITVVLLLSPFALAFIPGFVFDRLGTIEMGAEQKDESARARLILMQSGLAGALDNPIFGVGTRCWGAHAENYIPGGRMADGAYEPHSIWIKIAAELGFVGLGAYLLMFGHILILLKKIQKKCLKSGNKAYYNIAFMLYLSILGYCIPATFVNQIYFEYMFLLIALSGVFIRHWEEWCKESAASVRQADKTNETNLIKEAHHA